MARFTAFNFLIGRYVCVGRQRYFVLRSVVSETSQMGHSNVSKSRLGSPEGSIRVIHVLAPQREQGGRTIESSVVGTV